MDRKQPERTGPFFFRPADRTPESYRDFILSMAKALNPDAQDDLTAEEWRREAEQFWQAADSRSGLQEKS